MSKPNPQSSAGKRYALLVAVLAVCIGGACRGGSGQLTIPQVVSGEGFETEILLINNSPVPLSGRIDFFDSLGSPVDFTFQSMAAGRSAPFLVFPGGLFRLLTTQTGVLTSGYGIVRTDQPGLAPEVTVLFAFDGRQTAYPASLPGRAFRTPLLSMSPDRLALSLVNCQESALPVALNLLDLRGLPVETASLILPSKGRFTGFADELFEDLPAGFLGSLAFRSEGDFALLSLRSGGRNELAFPGVSRLGGEDPGPALFDGGLALAQVKSQLDEGPRPVGSAALRRAGDKIVTTLRALGWTVAEQLHTVRFDGVYVTVRNLSASYGQGETILLGAHYDTRIYADNDPDLSRRRDPVAGANDGASGVGVLLELARVLTQHYNPERQIRLVFFDAEDNGRIPPWSESGFPHGGWIVGSGLFAGSLELQKDPITSMILLDLVGEEDQRFPIEGYSSQSAPELVDTIWDLAAELGYAAQFPKTPGGFILDDHLPFVEQGIPAVDIIDLDYQYWHTTHDTFDKISPASLERVGRVLQTYLERSGFITRRESLVP